MSEEQSAPKNGAPAPNREAAPGPADKAPAARKSRGGLRKTVLLAALLGALGFGGMKGWNYYTHGRFVVSTDDAYVKSDMAIIATKVSGYIAEVPVRDNQPVKAGDLLVRLDDGDYRIAEDAAREKISTQDATIARVLEQGRAQGAQVEQARAQVNSAEAEVRRADAAFARAEALAKSNYSSQATFETARADRDRAQAGLSSAQAALGAAEANRSVIEAQRVEAQRVRAELLTALEKAKRDRGFTEIRAPFDGVIGNRAAQPGAFVQPGTRLLALVPLDSVYVEANFKETQLAGLKPGQPVEITVDVHSRRKIAGRLASIAPASGSQFSLLPPENATGNFTKIVQRVPVRIELPAHVVGEGWLRPGLSVVAGVDTGASGSDTVAQAGR